MSLPAQVRLSLNILKPIFFCPFGFLASGTLCSQTDKLLQAPRELPVVDSLAQLSTHSRSKDRAIENHTGLCNSKLLEKTVFLELKSKRSDSSCITPTLRSQESLTRGQTGSGTLTSTMRPVAPWW